MQYPQAQSKKANFRTNLLRRFGEIFGATGYSV